jgi:hypothetical protein
MSSSKSEEDGSYRRRSRPQRSRLFRVAATSHSGASEVKRRRDRSWHRSPAKSVPAPDECSAPDAPVVTATETPPPSAADTDPAWRDALQLWLRWNTAHTELTSRMFEVQHNSAMMEDLLDQVEQLRLEAVKLSEQLIA